MYSVATNFILLFYFIINQKLCLELRMRAWNAFRCSHLCTRDNLLSDRVINDNA